APDDRSGFKVPCPQCKFPLVVPGASTGAPPLPGAPNRPSQILPIPAPNSPSQLRLPPGRGFAPTGPLAASSPSKKYIGARFFLTAALLVALLGGGVVAFFLSPWNPYRPKHHQEEQGI